MTTHPKSIRVPTLLHGAVLVGALCAALIAGCGGGGGVGSGGTGAPIAEGTVTGFGSVIVDGVRFDDSMASVPKVERVPGRMDPIALRLGHHVVMNFEGATENAGSAQAIQVEPEIIGRVASVDAGAGTLVVLGQTVAVNSAPAVGPVTQFGSPWTGLASVAAGAGIEVHAVWRLDSTTGTRRLMATRLEPRVEAAVPLRVSGAVSAVEGQTLRIGALKVDVSATPTTVAVGQSVVVFGAATAYDAQSQTLRALAVRVKAREASATDGYLGGVVDQLSATDKTFLLNGVLVRYASATVDGKSTLASGQYVRVRGRFDGAAVLQATRVTVRSDGSDDSGSEAELHGSILGYNALTKQFTVRGQAVDGSGVTPTPASCTLQDLVYVEVKGTMTATGVRATEIQCETEGTGSVVDRSGKVSSSTATQFVLTPTSGTPYTVLIDSGTLLDGGLSLPLANGLAVKVEGDLSGSTLRARKIESDD